MIAKMKSNNSITATLGYNLKEESQIICVNNLMGETWQDFEKQMVCRQKLFEGRAEKLTAHIILSPSIEDGKKLTHLDWKEISNSFLLKVKLATNQSITFLHQDKEHFHLHIVANRIDEKGKIYRNGNELAMSQRVGDEIAVERGMRRASEVRRERLQAKGTGIEISEGIGSTAKIKMDLREAAIKATDQSGKFVITKYFENINTKGYEVKLSNVKDKNGTKTNEASGYAIRKIGERFLKASSLGREFTLSHLKQFRVNDENLNQFTPKSILLKNELAVVLQESFEKVMIGKINLDIQAYLEIIKSKGYIFKKHLSNATSEVRGYSVGLKGVLFNSSDVGKEFTLTNLKKNATKKNDSSIARELSLKREKEQILERSENEHQLKSDSLEPEMPNELTRTIDQVMITADLKDLTSGHLYKNYFDFIEAVEGKGYKVHLRYDNGVLNGYTLHKGTEHYHDREINNGELSLHQLIENGLFRESPSMPNVIFRTSHVNIQEATTGKPSFEKPAQSTIERNFIYNSNPDFINHETKGKTKLEKNKAKELFSSELMSHAISTIDENKSFIPLKYFEMLRRNGFEVIEHFNRDRGSLRGYSVQKLGFTFQSSEIGRDFTLVSLQKLAFELPKSEFKKTPILKTSHSY